MRTIVFSIAAVASAMTGIALVVAFVFGGGTSHGWLQSAATVFSSSSEASLNQTDGSAPDMGAVDLATSTEITETIIENAPEVTKEGKAVVADLEAMKVWIYEDGVAQKEFAMLSKGKPGSAWETPPGEYSIQYKTPSHFSSIGSVHMPFSMQFFGNFFIHGWPYYSSGKPVAEGYSGGCIRMSDADAEQIFNFVDVGTPIIVRGSTPGETSEKELGTYATLSSAKAPKVTALSYLVADLDSGDVILEKNKDLVRPIASITKLMTAIVSLEIINQFNETTISKRAADTYGAQGNLYAGEVIMVRDLLYPLLLESSNDAAEAIAEVVGRNYFIETMNEKADAMGLDATEFDDASGLSANNVSTAHDLFELSRYLQHYKRYVFDVTTRQEQEVGTRTWQNTSRFRNDEEYIGGKNGYTDEAMHTLIAMFELPLAEFENRNIAIILLGSQNREEDARALLEYVQKYVYYTHDE